MAALPAAVSVVCSEGNAQKAADKGRKLGVPIAVMFDCNIEAENGAKQATWELAQQRASLRLPWFRWMHAGEFADRQPESLTEEEWQAIRSVLSGPRRERAIGRDSYGSRLRVVKWNGKVQPSTGHPIHGLNNHTTFPSSPRVDQSSQ